MKKIFGTAMSCLMLATSVSAWVGGDNPANMDNRYSLKFDTLPMSGRLTVDQIPWSSSFWPKVYSGIAFRWNYFENLKSKPSFEPLHMKISSIQKDIESHQKEIYSRNTTTGNRHELIDLVKRLKAEEKRLEGVKATHYKRYFFSVSRPDSKAKALRMSREEIAQLSPAEKYDLYVGDYSLSLTRDQLSSASPMDAYWEGVCHGWSTAAIEFHEPKPISMRNKDGIVIDFGASDLKALLSYYHHAIRNNWRAMGYMQTRGVGQTCQTAFPKESWYIGRDGKEYYKEIVGDKIVVKKVPEDCVDTNAGAFHVVMANQLGVVDLGHRQIRMNESFIAEVVRDKEIWNQPVNGFKTEIIEDSYAPRFNATEGTVRQVRVKTRFLYANDGGRMFWPQNDPEEEFYAWWEPTNGTSNYREAHKDFEYYVDIDRAGNVIGGQWLSYERPDFIYKKTNKLTNTNGFVPTGWGRGMVNHMNALKNLVKVRK